MKIVVFGNKFRKEFPAELTAFLNTLTDRGVELLFEREFGFSLAAATGYGIAVGSLFTTPPAADLALSFGGDGTLLRTAGSIYVNQTPILGINFGHLGFLTDVQSNELSRLADIIINQEYDIEERIMLHTTTSDGRNFYSVNELTVHKQDISSIINIDVRLNGEELNTYHADGLIISTPTGSTAYSLSVGGPILMPESHNLIVAPVASHSLNDRPLVIPDDSHIDLHVTARSNQYILASDGESLHLTTGTTLHIERAGHNLHIIHLKNHSFLKTLKTRLFYGMDKRIDN